MKKLFQGLLLVGLFFTGDAIYHFVRSEQFMQTVLESMEKKNKETHDEGSEVRGYVSPKINKILIKMVYEMHADRAFVIEMHNGKENASSLPFVYYDMTYEEIRDGEGITYIQPQFENVNINNYQMQWYVADNTYFIGDVEDKTCILVDDMIDTAGTMCNAAAALKKMGAKEVYGAVTHAVLSGVAIDRLKNSVFKELVLLNTIPLPEEKKLPNTCFVLNGV
jgi:phosphoribosylpyrophosphate synthetase